MNNHNDKTRQQPPSLTCPQCAPTDDSVAFFIEGMDCADETRLIEKKLANIDGVKSVRFSLVSGEARVEFDREKITAQQIQDAISEAGFKARPKDQGKSRTPHSALRISEWLPTALSGILAAAGFLVQLIWSEQTAVFFYLPAIIAGGFPMFQKALAAVRHFRLELNALMSIAVVGAVAIGEWSEGATVVFLFSLAGLLETWSVERARRAVRTLMELAPQEALVRRNSVEMLLPVDQVCVGETVIIRPSQRIPLDGAVVGGSSSVNQAPITGEAMPVQKRIGDEVFAGSINTDGVLEIKTKSLASDSTIARIIHLVEEAQAQKAPSQAFIERFARYYTPGVIVCAVLITAAPTLLFGGDFTLWFYRALVMLVIACPCALVISTPVSVVCGLTSAARLGVLIKGGIHLENAGALRVIAFDKTGTLTIGKPQVTEIIPINHSDEREIIAIAAAVETRSEHPLAQAILEKARKMGLQVQPAENFRAVPGKGAIATINGKKYLVGSHTLCEETGTCSPELHHKIAEIESSDKTVVTVGSENELIGLITISDALRDGAKTVIKKLHALGIQRIVMLTGDTPGTASLAAQELGIDEFQASLMPEDKLTAVSELLKKYNRVGMVGDGVNDAPALARATLGIAMGAAGTDAALETADIALMADDLSRLPATIRLSRSTVSVIKQNIAFALFIKVLFLTLAAAGWATLWMAVFADMGASMIVIFNGLRLLKGKYS
ncbi:MAG: heavy metal translocating P-type ATPase [bacterium]